jgi:hypothetical protein
MSKDLQSKKASQSGQMKSVPDEYESFRLIDPTIAPLAVIVFSIDARSFALPTLPILFQLLCGMTIST